MHWNKRRTLMSAIAVAVLASMWIFALYEQAILATIQERLAQMQEVHAAHPLWFPLGYFLAYVVALTILIPADMLMMLLAGALFGVVFGSLLSCTAHTVGATINFAASRYLFKRMPAAPPKAQTPQSDAWFYLLLLRFTPLVPSHGISLMMGATRLSVWGFFSGTWLGSLPMSVLFVYLGKNLASIHHTSELVTKELVVAVLCALLVIVLGRVVMKRMEKKMPNMAEAAD